ncbi:C factor cell-cell signaling protein [Ephemerocybe angulata]|uniref:C factor cell-cell signaling protein n=1 Tax=Ephemerocybe angulata TaxID=980116 RepID=A0A8H6H8Y5_9AGAR|nr:C factor cell-cell signaling protein [Tulosesus angulatus]
MSGPFILVSPGATRGLGLALTRQFLRTTTLPVYTSHRTEKSDESLKKHVLEPLKDVDPKRLRLLKIDLTSEETISNAARALQESLAQHGDEKKSFIQTAFITGGVLFPEKAPADLDLAHVKETFQVNVISHMFMIKHFSKFLPSAKQIKAAGAGGSAGPAKWVHVSARVGSIEDNRRGGWYSYRASKAALNQVVKTFDIHLKMHKAHAMCVGVHPGTVKTDLSKGYWGSEERDESFEPDDSAGKLVGVVERLKSEQRGKIWDWAGKEVPP